MFIVGTWLSNANCRTWLGFSRRGSFVFVVKTKSHSPPLISAPTLWFSQCLHCVPTANFAPMCKNQQSFNGFSKSVVKPHFANICSAIFSWFPNRHEELAFSTPVVRMQGESKERIGKGAKRSRGYTQVSIKVWRFFWYTLYSVLAFFSLAYLNQFRKKDSAKKVHGSYWREKCPPKKIDFAL